MLNREQELLDLNPFMKVTSDLEEEVGLERSHMTLVKVTFDASGSNVTLLKNQLVALMVGRETEFNLLHSLLPGFGSYQGNNLQKTFDIWLSLSKHVRINTSMQVYMHFYFLDRLEKQHVRPCAGPL